MAEPLINRAALRVEIAEEFVRDGGVWMTPDSVLDAVLDYLRSVLTPEALECYPHMNRLAGHDLRRRIFGEEPTTFSAGPAFPAGDRDD
jgi:hypothetical protein